MSSNNALSSSQKNNHHNSSLRNHPHNSSQKNLMNDISQRGNTANIPLSGRIPPLNLRNITEIQSLPSQHNDKERFNSWPEDADYLLENIRCNSIILSDYHKSQYFILQSRLKYFRIPIIIISAFASVLNIGLQPYLDQSYISVLCAMLSLITGLIGSIELFLQVQKKMENELMNSRDFYLNAIDIYKVLSLEPEHRNGDGLKYLDGKFAVYCKMIENSNIINKSIQDQLAPIDSNMIEKILSNTSCTGDANSMISSKHYGDSGANGSTKKPRNSIYKSMATKKEKRSNTWTEQFISYFFNQPVVKESRELKRSGSFDNMLQKYDERLRSSSVNTMNNAYKPSINNLYRSSPRHSPAYKNSDMESVISDMDSIDTTERFDIYCKIIEKAELFDDEILEEIAEIMSFNNEIFSLEERVKIYCHILQHQDAIGGKNVMNGLKNILIGDYFHRKTKNEPMDMENQLKLFKSLMFFKDALGPSTIEKIKQLMMQNVKNQSKSSSEIKQGMMQKLFNMNFQGPRITEPKNEDIETGKDISKNDIDKYIKQQISEIFNYEDNAIPLVPLNRISRSRANSENKTLKHSEKYGGKTSLTSMKKMFDPMFDSSRQCTPTKNHKKSSGNSTTGETKQRNSSWSKYLHGNREDIPENRRFSGYGKPSPHPSAASLAQKNTEPEKHSSSDSEDWISYSNHGATTGFIFPSHSETKSPPDDVFTTLPEASVTNSNKLTEPQNIIIVTTELADSIPETTTPPSAPISTHAHFTTEAIAEGYDTSVNLFTPGNI